ncbi:MAG: adenylate kinase family protein [Candidatus Nezhaarchaeota archaeon]|nr:adenylate kinase family protein [Candidatus Nezhaarchaeota archaeon]
MLRVFRLLISGTPSVGKTTVAKKLAEMMDCPYINAAELIIQEQLYEGVDERRESFIVDTLRAREFFSRFLRGIKRVIVDSHVVDVFPRRLITKVIVLRIHPIEILRRGVARGWNIKKCIENAQAELLGTCLFDALSFYGEDKVRQLDCTNRKAEEIASEVLEALRGKGMTEVSIDWLALVEEDKALEILLRVEREEAIPKEIINKLIS